MEGISLVSSSPSIFADDIPTYLHMAQVNELPARATPHPPAVRLEPK